MNESRDSAATRAKFYNLLANAMNYPDTELALSLVEGRFRDDLISVAPAGASDLLAGLSGYSGGDKEGTLLEMERDYTWLFFASKPRIAHLFGSVYAESKLYQESTFEIVRLYHDAGLKVEESFKLPPDHIAVELEFLAYLAFNEAEALRTGNSENEAYARDLQEKALVKYVRPLAGNIGERIADRAKTEFYRTLGRLLLKAV